jgi:hypothetical protein
VNGAESNERTRYGAMMIFSKSIGAMCSFHNISRKRTKKKGLENDLTHGCKEVYL